MNIFRVLGTTLYPLFVYVLLFSRRNLVESTGAGASPIPGSGTKTGVDLSLKKTSGTNEFNYNKAGRVVTYTAKANYGFKSVKTGNKVVWEASNSDEYAIKVVLNGKGKKQKEVTIHLPNNTTKVFKRDGKGKPWTDVSHQSNQSNGQPGSGTPASGTSQPEGAASQSGEGTTGGRRMSSDPDGTPLASSGGDGTSSGNSTDQSTHGSGSTHSSSGEGTGTSGEGREDAKSGGWTSGSVQDGSASPPPADGGSDNDTSSGEGTKTADGSADNNSQPSGVDGGSKTGEDDTGTSGGDGSSATPPPTSGGDGTSRNPANSTNDLMQKFDTLVGTEVQPENYPGDFKFFKADPNDATKTVELTKSEYKVKHDVDEHIYVFYDLNCTLINHNNKEVWKYDSSKADAKYPKGMSVEPELMLIYFGTYTEVCFKRSDEWRISRTEAKDLSQLKVKVHSEDRE